MAQPFNPSKRYGTVSHVKELGFAVLALAAGLTVAMAGSGLLRPPADTSSGPAMYRVAGDYPTPVVGTDGSWLGVVRPGDVVLDTGEAHGSLRHVAGAGWDGWVIQAELAGPGPWTRGVTIAALSQTPRL